MRYLIYFAIIFNFIFSYENYKQIKIYNPSREIIYQISQLEKSWTQERRGWTQERRGRNNEGIMSS